MAKTKDSSAVRPFKAKAPATKADDQKRIEKAFISKISSVKELHYDRSTDPDGSPFLITASQVNTDLTLGSICAGV